MPSAWSRGLLMVTVGTVHLRWQHQSHHDMHSNSQHESITITRHYFYIVTEQRWFGWEHNQCSMYQLLLRSWRLQDYWVKSRMHIGHGGRWADFYSDPSKMLMHMLDLFFMHMLDLFLILECKTSKLWDYVRLLLGLTYWLQKTPQCHRYARATTDRSMPLGTIFKDCRSRDARCLHGLWAWMGYEPVPGSRCELRGSRHDWSKKRRPEDQHEVTERELKDEGRWWVCFCVVHFKKAGTRVPGQ